MDDDQENITKYDKDVIKSLGKTTLLEMNDQ